MAEIAKIPACKVVKVDTKTSMITIDVDTSSFGEYLQGNTTAVVVKVPFPVDSIPLAQARKEPTPKSGKWRTSPQTFDFSAFQNPGLAHGVHCAIDDWIDANPGVSPPCNDASF